MDTKNIVTISVIVVAAALIVGVFIYFGGSRSGVSGGLQTVAPLSADESNALSRDFLLALSSLNSLQLDSSFFDDTAFKTLVDYSKDIKDEDLGRDNPFLPVGGDVTPVAQPAPVAAVKSVPTSVIKPVINTPAPATPPQSAPIKTVTPPIAPKTTQPPPPVNTF